MSTSTIGPRGLGMCAWVDEVDEHVPELQARRGQKRKLAGAPAGQAAAATRPAPSASPSA